MIIINNNFNKQQNTTTIAAATTKMAVPFSFTRTRSLWSYTPTPSSKDEAIAAAHFVNFIFRALTRQEVYNFAFGL